MAITWTIAGNHATGTDLEYIVGRKDTSPTYLAEVFESEVSAGGSTVRVGLPSIAVTGLSSHEDAVAFVEAFEQAAGDLRLRRDKALRALGYAPDSHRLMRIIRDGLGLTGEELADKLGVSARTVRKWEAGQLKVSDGVWFDLYELEETAARHVADGILEGEDWPDGWRRAIAFRQRTGGVR